jgi:hypothetical protein
MLRSREQAVLAFKPLLSLEDNAFNKVAEKISRPNRRGEWIAILLGICILGVVLAQPWTLDWASGYFWMTVYYVITEIIGMGLMGWLIYDTSVGIVRISRLSRQNLKIDILDTETLTPVATWSLGISLVFVGIVILSVISDVTQTASLTLDYKYITGYVFVIGITLLIFFFSMWSVHRAISEAKKSKLATIRKHMSAVSGEVDERMALDQFSGTEKLSHTMTVLVNYQKLVKAAPTWPFNAGIIRRLIASTIVPIIVYIIKIISGLGLRF